jgi:polyphosphate glucokinase
MTATEPLDGPPPAPAPRTLAVDIGGSGFKAAVLDSDGTMLSERLRIDTPYPCPPETFIEAIGQLAALVPVPYDRVSVGFPGLVRTGVVLMVPSLSRLTYLGDPDPGMAEHWRGFALAAALEQCFGHPVKVANDADVQGCAVVQGKGLEFVMTLGTGCGTALFHDGVLMPHLELGHAPFRKGETFEEQIGNAARKVVGNSRWSQRVLKAIDAYHQFLFFDHMFIGGGNSKHVDLPLPSNATIVPNTAGILGGIKLWDLDGR